MQLKFEVGKMRLVLHDHGCSVRCIMYMLKLRKLPSLKKIHNEI